MPPEVFLARLYWCQQYLGLSQGKILLNDHPKDIKNFLELVRKLAYIFNISQASIKYKLKDMNLINNQSRIKTFGQIINEQGEQLFI